MGRKVKAEVTGVKQIQQNIASFGNRWEKALSAGLYLAASNVMARSKRLVPVDLGALKASGYVTLPQKVGDKILVEEGYGGVAKDYAVVQHERLDFKHPGGGGPKYLERAVDEASGSLASDILKLAKAAFESNLGPTKGPMPTNPDEGQPEPKG